MYELQHAREVVTNQDDNKKRAYYNYENQKKNIELELKTALDEIEQLRTKGLAHDDLVKQVKQLEIENEILEHQNQMHRCEQKKPLDINQELIMLRRKNHMLSKDKEYLEK